MMTHISGSGPANSNIGKLGSDLAADPSINEITETDPPHLEESDTASPSVDSPASGV